MKNLIKLGAAMAIAATGVVCPANAEGTGGKLFGRIGPLAAIFDSSAEVKVGGSIVPGGSAEAKNNLTLGFEVGYIFSDNVTATFTAGIPPTTSLKGTGALSSGGVLGKAMYAPAVFAAQYHFTNFDAKFRPYIGAGLNYTIIIDEKDAFLKNLNIDNAFGSVIQAGVNSDIGKDFGLFADVKKIYLKADSKAIVPAFGNAPAEAKVTLDPLIVMVGISKKF